MKKSEVNEFKRNKGSKKLTDFMNKTIIRMSLLSLIPLVNPLTVNKYQ